MRIISGLRSIGKNRAFPKTKRLKIKRDLRGEYDPRVFNPRYILQRAKYGFCEADALFISRWFCRVVPDMLEYMADEKNLLSYPSRLEYEYWERHKDEIGVDFIR
ncbi:MAG: hypothetical protein IJV00_07130, partial [Clostridia bacterium]|nr:hypothetical protein [Clostridia bacterium]